MRLSYMREFVVLSRCETFAEAADKLFLSRPTLANHIASMEKDLGYPLVSTGPEKQGSGPSRFSLTREGTEFLGGCERIIRDYDDLLRRCDRINGAIEVRLSSVITYNALPLFNEARRRWLREKGEDVELFLFSAPRYYHADSPFVRLEEGLDDVNLAYYVPDEGNPLGECMMGYDAFPLCQGAMGVIGEADNPLLAGEAVSLEMLEGQLFLMDRKPKTMHAMGQLKECLRRRGICIEHAPVDWGVDESVLYSTLGNRLIWAPSIEWAKGYYRDLGHEVRVLPVVPEIPVQVCAVYKADNLNEGQMEFLEELKALASSSLHLS